MLQADIVKLLKEYTKKRTCAIGDGGNDVSMIQAADVGIGIYFVFVFFVFASFAHVVI